MLAKVCGDLSSRPAAFYGPCVLVILFVSMATVQAVDRGFELLFETSDKSFENLKIEFEKPVDDWIRGIYIMTGPGQFSMGPTSFKHVFDGYAKLYSWRFNADGGGSTFSTKFVQTDFFKDSEASGDIAPYLLFDSTDPPFGFFDQMEALFRGIDNTNTNIVQIGENASCFLSVCDFWHSHEFNPFTLDTISRYDPKLPLDNFWSRLGIVPVPSTAHPVPEDEAMSSYISMYSLLSPFSDLVGGSVNVVRMKSGLDRELIASIPMNRVPYMHSFALSKHYAVIFAHPLFIDLLEILKTSVPVESLVWEPEVGMNLHVVDLRTGAIHTIPTSSHFVTHCINAFEEPDGTNVLNVDAVTYPTPDLFKDLLLKNLRDPVLRDTIRPDALIRRYRIDLDQKSVSVMTFDQTPGLEFVSRLDMPVINERYRLSKYCYVYGTVMKSDGVKFANASLGKKCLCGGSGDDCKDRAWNEPNHYPAEPWFVARPGGTREDDGVLLSIVLDGDKRQSYMAILNATTMAMINRSYLPIVIPFTLHGKLFSSLASNDFP